MAANGFDIAEAAMEVNDFFIQQLECPVCLHMCEKPILMCVNGHNVCTRCQVNMKECPVCRAPGAFKSRNIVLEALSLQVLQPCKFNEAGCEVKRNVQDLDVHYANCEYRFQCGVCNVTGTPVAIYDHVSNEHRGNIIAFDKVRNWPYITDKKTMFHQIFKLENEYFWFSHTFIPTSSSLHFYVRYIGQVDKASNFKFEIQISSVDKSTVLTTTVPAIGVDDDYRSNTGVIELSGKYFIEDADGKCQLNFRVQEAQSNSESS